MDKTCGKCPLILTPSKKTLKEAGMEVCNIGYCADAGDFVALTDTADDWGCIEEDDPWQR